MARRLKVTLSYAQSIDGRIATASGESRWISGPATLRLAQTLRKTHEVILVGIGTVLRDDPELTCRLRGCASPVRVVLDSRLRLPLESAVVRTIDRAPTVAVAVSGVDPAARERLEAAGVQVAVVPADDAGRPALPGLVEFLEGQGYRSLFVEGGGAVITSFLRARLVDRLVVVTAPVLIGSGVAAVGDLGVEHLSEALRPDRARVRRAGADLVWELAFRGA
jgi:riboflavin-specific deaminase-like protein